MKGKAALVVGLAVGYVLGAKAGRKRYDQIKSAADKVWDSAPVQAGAAKVQEISGKQLQKLQKKASEALKAGFAVIFVRESTTPKYPAKAPEDSVSATEATSPATPSE